MDEVDGTEYVVREVGPSDRGGLRSLIAAWSDGADADHWAEALTVGERAADSVTVIVESPDDGLPVAFVTALAYPMYDGELIYYDPTSVEVSFWYSRAGDGLVVAALYSLVRVATARGFRRVLMTTDDHLGDALTEQGWDVLDPEKGLAWADDDSEDPYWMIADKRRGDRLAIYPSVPKMRGWEIASTATTEMKKGTWDRPSPDYYQAKQSPAAVAMTDAAQRGFAIIGKDAHGLEGFPDLTDMERGLMLHASTSVLNDMFDDLTMFDSHFEDSKQTLEDFEIDSLSIPNYLPNEVVNLIDGAVLRRLIVVASDFVTRITTEWKHPNSEAEILVLGSIIRCADSYAVNYDLTASTLHDWEKQLTRKLNVGARRPYMPRYLYSDDAKGWFTAFDDRVALHRYADSRTVDIDPEMLGRARSA